MTQIKEIGLPGMDFVCMALILGVLERDLSWSDYDAARFSSWAQSSQSEFRDLLVELDLHDEVTPQKIKVAIRAAMSAD